MKFNQSKSKLNLNFFKSKVTITTLKFANRDKNKTYNFKIKI